jgi:hypothetical protein
LIKAAHPLGHLAHPRIPAGRQARSMRSTSTWRRRLVLAFVTITNHQTTNAEAWKDPWVPTHALDQPDWQALTTWQGNPPANGSAWELLTDPQLPESFRNCVCTLSHPFLRKLQLEANVVVHLDDEPALEKGKRWNNRFANLVSGRFTEKLFYQTYAKSGECRRQDSPRRDVEAHHEEQRILRQS